MKNVILKFYFKKATSNSRTLTKINSKFWGWRDSWANVLYNHLVAYPNYLNSMYFWTFGFVGTLFFGIQLVSGILLSMQYTAYSTISFDVVEHIMRDVNFGWLVRYLHANGASFFFFVIYLHIMRGLFFSSYSNSRGFLWLSGILIFILMMAIAFLGYILPWGQMSFWGATVITNLFSAIPFIGDSIAFWLWGGFSVDNATLVRFFSLHYLLPFVLFGLIIVHFFLLHIKGSTNPCGTDSTPDIVSLYPNFIYKDLLSILFFIILYLFFVFYDPNFLGHSDNYIPANPLVTPAHIVPEWYFLPFYAILRAIPNKLGGVLVMGGALVVLLLLPFLTTSYIRTTRFRPLQLILCFCFAFNFILLGWLGGQPVTIIYILLGRFCAYFYFCVILILLPLLWAFESLSTVYFKYELEDISRWINNHWELYSLRLVKSRWEVFYSLFIFFIFFCAGCISLFFLFGFNLRSITKEDLKCFFRKFVFFFSPRILCSIVASFLICVNIVIARNMTADVFTVLKNTFYRMKQKFCDCASARNGSMCDMVSTQEKAVSESESIVKEPMLQIYYNFDLFLFGEIFVFLIILLIMRRAVVVKLLLLFLQRKPLGYRFLDDTFFMKNTYKDLFLGCLSLRIYKEVVGDQDMKGDSFIGIYSCLKFIVFIFFSGLVFSWSYLCCEHIGIFYGLIGTHLLTSFSVIGCLFIFLAIKLEEFYRYFSEKRGSIDAFIGAVMLQVVFLFVLKITDLYISLASLVLVEICFFVLVGVMVPAISKAKLALALAASSFITCFGFFLMISQASLIKYDLPLKKAERGVIVAKEVSQNLENCVMVGSAVAKSVKPQGADVGKNIASTFIENSSSVGAFPFGNINIYRLSEHLVNFKEVESCLFFCGPIIILIAMFGNFFFLHLFKDFISSLPFSVFSIMGLLKVGLLYYMTVVAIAISGVSPEYLVYFQLAFAFLGLYNIVLAALNANNIRFGFFCFMTGGGFLVAAAIFSGFSGQMLLIEMYAVFNICGVALLAGVVAECEVRAKRNIIYFSDLFNVMKEHSFSGIIRIVMFLLNNLSFPLFFGFYYKGLAFAAVYAAGPELLGYFTSGILIILTVFQSLYILLIFHNFYSSIMSLGVGIIFHKIRTATKEKKIYFFSFVHYIFLYFFFIVFFIMGAFYSEILTEVPRFGEAFDLRRVVDLYPYVDTEVALHGNKAVVYVTEPLWWQRTTFFNGHYTLDGALTEEENAELLRAGTDCKKLFALLKRMFGRAELDHFLQKIAQKNIESNNVNK